MTPDAVLLWRSSNCRQHIAALAPLRRRLPGRDTETLICAGDRLRRAVRLHGSIGVFASVVAGYDGASQGTDQRPSRIDVLVPFVE